MIDDDGGTGAEAAARLLPHAYGELKRIAHHQLRTGTARATLCTTELVQVWGATTANRTAATEGFRRWRRW